MEKKYYAFIDGEEKGPFALEELPGAGVRPTTYIWCKGKEDWEQAADDPEVSRLYRRHLSNLMHPSMQQDVNVVMPQGSGDQAASTQTDTGDIHQRQSVEESEDEERLKDVPIQFRRAVKKSGTTPGPALDTSPDIDQMPRVSMALAILSMLVCFLPTGIACVVYSYKALNTWKSAASLNPEQAAEVKTKAHEYARQAKMWLGLTVSFGCIFYGFIFSRIFGS